MENNDQLIYQIGMTLIPGVGNILGKKLLSICGSAENVFREPRQHLMRLARIGPLLASAAGNKEILLKAEREAKFVVRYGITPLFYQDHNYPGRLKHCIDSPILLFFKGIADLNAQRVVAVVGTRRATEYGRECTRQLIAGLKPYEVLVVSGLAYGIDSCAHRFSLDTGSNTIGVLGHGLDLIYPWSNRSLAEKMVTQGGLITEFLSGTKPDRTNFPMRNRIIAGLSDAVIVVEAGNKGGALITADIANSYNRDVFSVPGRIHDSLSEGTNFLIRTNRAALIQQPDDIAYMMGWKNTDLKPRAVQQKIFLELSPGEEKIVEILRRSGQTGIDELCNQLDSTLSAVSALLLNLEFEGVIRCLPGKIYSLA